MVENLLYSLETKHGTISVVDDSVYRGYYVDGVCQGMAYSISPHVAHSWYVRQMLNYLADKGEPTYKTALVLGGGPCLIPSALNRRRILTDVVDINPASFCVAQEFFGYRPIGNNFVDDALTFAPKDRYDVVMVDLYHGWDKPKGAYELGRYADFINPRGIMLVNYVSERPDRLSDEFSDIYSLYGHTYRMAPGNIFQEVYYGKNF